MCPYISGSHPSAHYKHLPILETAVFAWNSPEWAVGSGLGQACAKVITIVDGFPSQVMAGAFLFLWCGYTESEGPFIWIQGLKRGSTWEQSSDPDLGESSIQHPHCESLGNSATSLRFSLFSWQAVTVELIWQSLTRPRMQRAWDRKSEKCLLLS